MAPVDVSVVMVTWNSADVLPASLEALEASRPAPTELVILDNASRDATLEIIELTAQRAPFPFRVLRSTVNIGFAAGMNRAIAAAVSHHVLLLNPDLRVTPGMIGRLHEVLVRSPSDVYAVGPRLMRAGGNALEPTDVFDSTGIQMTRDGRHFDRGAGQLNTGQFDEGGEVFGLSGAALMLRMSALDDSKVDGEVFDEDFFAFREDVDLAWRMRGFGYRALYEPAAVGYHLRRVTPERRRSLPPEINRHSVKNRFLLRIHHADSGWLRAFGLRSLRRDLVVIAACLTIERSSFSGLVWVVRNARRHFRRRREILARRRVHSDALRHWFQTE